MGEAHVKVKRPANHEADDDLQSGKPGMMWGDCGRLYFWIRQQDLASKAFEKSWMILQCS